MAAHMTAESAPITSRDRTGLRTYVLILVTIWTSDARAVGPTAAIDRFVERRRDGYRRRTPQRYTALTKAAAAPTSPATTDPSAHITPSRHFDVDAPIAPPTKS